MSDKKSLGYQRAAKGIAYREHPTRKHGKRADRYYVLVFKREGKTIREAVGWASDGVTQSECEAKLVALRENWRTGQGPQTLTEMRRAAESQRLVALQAEEQLKKESLTFAEFFEQTYLPAAAVTKKEKSLGTENGLFHKWIAPAFGETPLHQITAPMVEALQASILKAGKSPATARYALAVISQVWNAAYMRNIVHGENPCRRVKRPKFDNRRMRFLREDEARALLEMLQERSSDTHDACILSLFCGLRAGEIHALTWTDIDLSNGTISIRDPKNRKNRHAYMTGEVLEMLQYRFQARDKNQYVFSTGTGDPKKQISNVFVAAVRDLGLNNDVQDPRQKVVFHSLRHTFASWHVMAGTPLFVVGELLGHSSHEMTKRYSHLAPDATRAAAMVLQGKLNEKASAKVLPFVKGGA